MKLNQTNAVGNDTPQIKPSGQRSWLPLLACVLLSAITSIATAAETSRPNVLFIAVDDLRPEIGCYGNKLVKTPNIDRIASRGTVFNHAYCQQAVCSPSRASLLTGQRPDTTRVWDLNTHFRVALPDVVTLPQYFKANGYHCAALSKLYHYGLDDGLSWSEPNWYPRGYTVDTDPKDWNKRITKQWGEGVKEYSAQILSPEDNDAPNIGGKKKGPAFEVSPKSDDELPDGCTAAEAVKRLHELKAKGQPFFLAVGFLKPHLPFVAPKKYWDLYDPDRIPTPAIGHLPEGAPAFAGHNSGELHTYANIPEGNPIPEDLAKTLRHGYYACISYTDAQIGRLLDALDKEGLAGNTIIVLWGDHGWQLGDHGLWNKHTNFELATRAPLLLSVPQQKSAGKKCNTPVEFVDVYPTLADLCGLPVPSGLAGVSLKPLMENPAVAPGRVAISQYPRSPRIEGTQRQLMGYSIRNERYRLTLWRDRKNGEIVATELYDEQNDPNEAVNIADKPENKTVIESLSKHLPPLPDEKQTPTKPTAQPAAASAEKSPSTAAATPAKGSFDRTSFFKSNDQNKDGKLSLEEFTKNQRDSAAAKERFEKWDKDKDGFLSQDEYVFKGKPEKAKE